MKHAEIAALLPLYHRDPFDHILIAQSLAEDLTLVTVDNRLKLYEVKLFLFEEPASSVASNSGGSCL